MAYCNRIGPAYQRDARWIAASAAHVEALRVEAAAVAAEDYVAWEAARATRVESEVALHRVRASLQG